MSTCTGYLRYARISTHRIFVILFLLASFVRGQVTIFSEDFGSGTGPINNLVFQNTICVLYTGTSSGSNAVNSSGYSGASGGSHILLDPGETFQVQNINTVGYDNLELLYGLSKSNPANLNGVGLLVEISTTGAINTYSALTRSTPLWLTAWRQETLSTTNIPQSTTLFIRFTNNSSGLDLTNFNLDDITLSGQSFRSATSVNSYSSWTTPYSFTNWSNSSSQASYPNNIIFHYGTSNTTDPAATLSATADYTLPYNLSCGTRITGLGTGGISFANSKPGNASGTTGNLGETVLSLDTRCQQNLELKWTAGLTANYAAPYKLRGQYRVGNSGGYLDLPNNSLSDIEYTSPTSIQNFTVQLPSNCDNQPLVEIRWVFYAAGNYSAIWGSRDEIFLDDISVTSQPIFTVTPFAKPVICGTDTMPPPTINPQPSAFSWTNSVPSVDLTPINGGNSTFPTLIAPVLSDTLDKIATVTFTATLGSCNYVSSLTTTVKGKKEKTTWDGSHSTNWFNHDNWSNCVCHDSAEGKIASGLHAARISTGVGKAKTLIVANNATLVVDPGGTLEIKENFQNDDITVIAGKVLLNGTATQVISGSKPTFFSELEVTNPTTVSLQDSVYIIGSLKLSAGTFSTGGRLRLISRSSTTGRIAPLTGGADINGDVNIERLAPGGATGWAQFGMPITASNTFAQWDDDFVITCPSCTDGHFGFTSIYSYNEAAGLTTNYNDPNKYIGINDETDPTTIGKGYWVYFGNGNSSTDIKFTVTGPVAKNLVPIPVTNSNINDLPNNGWNLISNPMPSALSWVAIAQTNTILENAYYVYNADLGSGQGGYASFVNAVTSPSNNGLTDDVPMCQGFYVHAKSSGTIIINESMKSAGNPVFMKQQPSAIKPIFRLSQTSTKHHDECAFYFETGATQNFQGNYDAYKLNFDPDNIPYIGSLADSILTSINGLPVLSSNISVDVKAITPLTGTFSFSGVHTDFPYDVCVTLHDKYTGIITDLLTSSYTCTLYDSTTAARFKLNFYSKPLFGSGHALQPDCQKPSGGYLTAVANSNGPWNYEWSQNGSIIKSTFATPSPDTLYAPLAGPYSVKINTAGRCDRFEKNFYVNYVESTFANFSTDVDTTYLSQGGTVYFKDNSVNSLHGIWDFGNGHSVNMNTDPVYSYYLPGNFLVQLFTESSTGCKDTAEKTIVVIDGVTNLLINSAAQEIVLTYDNSSQNYSLTFNFKEMTNVEMQLLDQKGILLRKEDWTELKNDKKTINLNAFSEGVYLLQISLNKQLPMVFKLIH